MQVLWRALRTVAAVLMQAAGYAVGHSPEDTAVTDQQVMLAVVTENLEIIVHYLRRPANIDRRVLIRGHLLSPLHLACQLGKLSIVKLFIQAKADLGIAGGEHGYSPLHFASHFGHQPVIDLLIRAQADVNMPDSDGYSPLYIASNFGHHDIVETLVRALADADLPSNTGESSLYIASNFGHQKVVDTLIKAQADVNIQEKCNGSSSLYMASQNGHQQVVDSLIKAKADVDLVENDGFSPLYIASQNGHLRVVDLLIRAQADVNLKEKIFGSSPIYIASQNGFEKIVRLLIKAQADVNFRIKRNGYSPIYYASRQGHVNVLHLLIEAGAEVNIQTNVGESPILIASLQGHQKVVDTLIQANADVNLQASNGFSPLHAAAQAGHQRVLESLIRARADVNTRAQNGESPLYIASQNGYHEVVNSLIKAKADVNLQRNNGESPLYIASQNGHQPVVDLLIRSKANCNLQSNNGAASIYTASHFGHQQVVKSLVKAEADVDLQINSGESPLFIASHFGHHKVVAALIDAQADVNLQNKAGESPVYIASAGGHKEAVDLLIRAQAEVNLPENHGVTPLFIASQDGHLNVVKSLLKSQADVNRQTSSGSSPLYIASQNGHQLVVDSLLEAQADVNIQTNSGSSSLYIASQNGHKSVVDSLIRAQAQIDLRRDNGLTPLDVASYFGHHQVVRSLRNALLNSFISKVKHDPIASNSESASLQLEVFLAPSDEDLSRQLHKALTQSGFVSSRAVLQTAIADVLQEILRKRLNGCEIFVVGSYSEGWGNNLKSLDGRTDIESDIDVMILFQGKLHHQMDLCECDGAPTRHKYFNGHLLCPGFTSNPARPSYGSALRPAVDHVSAGRLCRYPIIALLQPDRVSKSHISKSLIQDLQRDISPNSSSPCHVVHAASPDRGGDELRVSTSFLEKRMLRSLTTLQGQLFITLKYLVKKVICHKDGYDVQGVKPYHVKTITFRMLEQIPADQWRQENLVSLVRQSLQMLLDCVESGYSPGNPHGQIMEHFFLSDAALYLKGVNQKDSKKILGNIASTLRKVINQLPQLLLNFMHYLKPLNESGRFYFHPFQIMPDIRPLAFKTSGSLEYHEIYDVVRDCLLRLSHGDCSVQSQESLTEMIARLPDCALTTREALRALACLKFGYRGTAEKIVSHYSRHLVSRGIDWSFERSATEATVAFVWQHLMSRDTAWKFCFQFETRPEFDFVGGAIACCFPISTKTYEDHFFMNFDALMWAMRLELQAGSDQTAEAWIWDLADREDADVQELLVAISYCFDFDCTKVLMKKLHGLKGDIPDWLRREISRRWPIKS